MPYVKPERRADLEEEVGIDPRYIGYMLDRGADLNYMIYGMCVGFLAAKRVANGEVQQAYDDFEPVIMALEGAKFELLRRRLAIVEDDAIVRNTDVAL